MIGLITKKDIREVRWHGVFHILHGLLPWFMFFENKVATPDRDHRSAIGRRTHYWEHLKKNMRCARHCFRKMKEGSPLKKTGHQGTKAPRSWR